MIVRRGFILGSFALAAVPLIGLKASTFAFETDVNGNIERVNREFAKFTGYGEGELIGQNPRILKGPTHPSVFDDLWATIIKGQSWEGTLINQKKNGDLYEAVKKITPIPSNVGTKFSVAFLGCKSAFDAFHLRIEHRP